MTEVRVLSTVSAVLEHLQLILLNHTGAPVVFDPNGSHNDCVSEYRKGKHHRHQDQDLGDRVTPNVIGYTRSSMRFKQGLGPKPSQVKTSCLYRDESGDLTGRYEVLNYVRGEVDLNFTYYSTDIREVEQFEVMYMSGQWASSLKKIRLLLDSGSPEDELEVDYAVDWNYDTDLSFVRDESFYIAYNFRCTVSGGFLTGTGVDMQVDYNSDGTITEGALKAVLVVNNTLKAVRDVDVPN